MGFFDFLKKEEPLPSGPAPEPPAVDAELRDAIFQAAEHHDRPHALAVYKLLLGRPSLLIALSQAPAGTPGSEYKVGQNALARGGKHPTFGEFVAVYTDFETCKRAPGFAAAIMHTRAVFDMAVKKSSGVILNVDGPDYMGVPFADARQLAAGRLPRA